MQLSSVRVKSLGLILVGGILVLTTPACYVDMLPGSPDDLALGIGDAKAAALEQPRCHPTNGSGSTIRNDETGEFEGSGVLIIRHMDYEVSIVTVVLGDPWEGDDGTLHAATSHTFSFDEDNTFTTTDKAILEPTDEPGVFTLNSNMRITSGTGAFDGSSGKLHGHGEIDLFNGTASFDLNGVICDVQLPPSWAGP